MKILVLLISLAIILAGAEVFTNGIEWLGRKLKLSEGAVGSILAAVGTALPETLIPVIAILFGTGEEAANIGIGAILGAPFMLATLAFAVTGIGALCWTYKGRKRTKMMIDPKVMERDLLFFLIVFSIAILAAFMPQGIKYVIVVALPVAYLVYAYLTVTHNKNGSTDDKEEKLPALYFNRKNPDPKLSRIVAQVIAALALIIIGAELFVDAIEYLSYTFGIPAFVLSLIIAPIATELPEKFNSLIWIKRGKDTLALGNITGAMVFQSSIIPAIGIALTNWQLTPLAFISAGLALLSSLIIFLDLKIKNRIKPVTLLSMGSLYIIFIIAVIIFH